VTSRGELQKVETINPHKVDTGQVAESLVDSLVLVEDYKWSAALDVATVAKLSLSGADLARVGALLNVRVDAKLLQKADCILGLLELLDSVIDNDGDLTNVRDAVAAGLDEGGKRRRSDGRRRGETALVLVDASVPMAPNLVGSEHASTSAHVTIRSLTAAASTSTTDTGNTGNGATSSPGDGGSLATGIVGGRVWLALVLAHVGVNEVDNIVTDGGKEDSGQGNR